MAREIATSRVAQDSREPRKTQKAVTTGGSPLRRYQQVMVGRTGVLAMLYYEFCSWLGAVPGALGMALRKLFWPRMFGSCGPGVVFGGNIVIRHPHRIHLGSRVVVSDGCILDARNDGCERAIVIEDDGILSNNVMISCKDGSVRLGPRAGLGAQSIIHSVSGCPVVIGADVMIGPQCYLSGGSDYNIDRLDVPMSQQGIRQDTGVRVADDVWLGAKATVTGGVAIGRGSVVGAGAVVTRSVPERTIAVGVPARPIKRRAGSENPEG